MKKTFFFLAITLLFFSCKKGDIQIPLKETGPFEETDPLEGKLKTLVLNVNGAPSSEELEYNFEYDEDGALQKILISGGASLEWVSNDDSLKLRYKYLEVDSSEVVIDMYIEHELSSIKTIKVLSTEFGPVYEEHYNVYGNASNLDSIIPRVATYFPSVNGIYNLDAVLSDYQFYSDGYEVKANYGYRMIFAPVEVRVTDTLRIINSGLTSSVPVPSQSYGSITPWYFTGNDFISLSIYFLQLSDYHIYKPYVYLPEQIVKNGNVLFDIDYQLNTNNQVTEMNYISGNSSSNSNWSFSYY